MEFAHVCRQVIDVINLRKLTNRQVGNSKHLSKTVDFFREANPANRKSLLIYTHSYSFLPIPTHCYSFWNARRIQFCNMYCLLVVLDIGFTQKETGSCEKTPFPFIPFYSLLLPFWSVICTLWVTGFRQKHVCICMLLLSFVMVCMRLLYIDGEPRRTIDF